MIWVGLTGGIASGKSTVSAYLKDLGFSVINADELAHQAVVVGSPALEEIKRVFGAQSLIPMAHSIDDFLEQKFLETQNFQLIDFGYAFREQHNSSRRIQQVDGIFINRSKLA